MGVKGLNSIINKYAQNGINKKYLKIYKNKKIAIDTNLYLYKYSYDNNNMIDGFFFQINKLKKFNITPIYIFDGKPPEEKKNTILSRKNTKLKLKKKINTLEEELKLLDQQFIDKNNLEYLKKKKDINEKIKKYQKGIIYITKNDIDKVKMLFKLMGVVYIEANCESEHYCSKLINEKLVDLVLTEDMDTLACGANFVLKNFSNKSDFIIEYDTEKILESLKLSKKEFIDLCILCGNDYINRLKGYNPYEIYNLVCKHKNIETIYSRFNLTKGNKYKIIRNIYNLHDIDISKFNYIYKNYNRSINKPELTKFLKNFSNMDDFTYKKRINLMLSNKNFYKSDYILKLQNLKINKNL